MIVELRSADPMVELGWLVRPPAVGDAITAVCGNATFAAVMFFVTLYYQEVRGFGPIATGMVFLAMTIPLGIMSPFAGRALRHVAPEVLLGVGMLVLAGSAGLFLLVTDSSSLLVLLAALAVSGVGQAVVFNVSNIEAVGSVPIARSGMAAGVVSAVRQMGSLVGLAATSAAFAAASAGSLLTRQRVSERRGRVPRRLPRRDGGAARHLRARRVRRALRPPSTRRVGPKCRRRRGRAESCGQRADEGGPGTSLTGTLNCSRASSSGVSL